VRMISNRSLRKEKRAQNGSLRKKESSLKDKKKKKGSVYGGKDISSSKFRNE